MKIVIILACVVAAASAQFNRASSFASFANPYKSVAVFPAPQTRFTGSYSGNDAAANILRYENEVSPDGSYNYYYETDNGISAQAQGYPRNFGGSPPVIPSVAQGSFSWTSPEGQPISISYVADENGYQPQGDAIPTPPPVPPQIARALEYIRSIRP